MSRQLTSARKRRIRKALALRDGGWFCRYCGAEGDEDSMTIDHIRASARGGTNDRTNLVLACRPCNLDKGDR